MTMRQRNPNSILSSTSATRYETQPRRGSGREKANMQMVKQTVTGARSATAWVCTLATVSILSALCGCSGGLSPASFQSATPVTQKGIHGSVFGGQQPVQGAAIQLYTVGTSGPGSMATPLITPGLVTTDVNGDFLITGDYSCASATQVYLTATGGNAGQGSNSDINLMAPLGLCSTLQANASTTFVQINEVTTVASVYALAPFMTSYTNIGATGSNPVGLVNAVANFNNLVNISSGLPGGASLPAGATVPTTEINTLADVLAACVNSTIANACNTLLGATGASDTLGAALAIAKNPGSSTYTALYTLASGTPPFVPAFAAQPNDWTVAINYTGSGTLSSPTGIAIDATGNAWVTNGSGLSANTGLVELTSTGTLYNKYNGDGLIGAKGLAIDRTGNVWVANPATNAVIEFNSAGVAQGSFTGGGLSGPVSLAIDSGGNVWAANLNGTTVTELSSSGSPAAGNGSTGFSGSGSINLPSGIAIDSTGNVWVANYGNSNVVKLTNSGAVAAGSPFSDLTLQGPSSIAIDSSNDAWVPGATTGAAVAGAVSQFSSTGTAASGSPFSGGGLLYASGVATSGTTAWVVNKKSGSGLTQIVAGQTLPSSPASGFGSLNAPAAVAVDASGDVWTANSGDSTVSQFIGLTTAVTTPIAANVGP
jgi:streptogramin lyase